MKLVLLLSAILALVAAEAQPEPEPKAEPKAEPQFGSRPYPNPYPYRQNQHYYNRPYNHYNRPYNHYNRPYSHFARTIHDFRQNNHQGAFDYDFRTENGISASASGRPGLRGQSNVAGTFSYQHPEGNVARVDYVADEFGYRATSPLIPPTPAHSLQQIRKADYERARGIRWY
ncbi:cuticle protein AM1199-like isoform X2 [Palaemon carinicauda]|uniref:cuticle protein AM1199-like isoform X2 n=1 Tax=Palaemon carinicauda TaxID=392227 RepID=UPI0035B65DB0